MFHEWRELALKQFQKAKKLKVTGKMGGKTAKKLGIL
ncbi:peptidoglycan-binding domain-containing protein [uncultured Methanobrevibacter sp.]